MTKRNHKAAFSSITGRMDLTIKLFFFFTKLHNVHILLWVWMMWLFVQGNQVRRTQGPF